MFFSCWRIWLLNFSISFWFFTLKIELSLGKYDKIDVLTENLRKAVNEKDLVAIENMAMAQYMAGMGFSNVGLGIVHSMAHQLGAVYDTPHGIANAILLPTVMKFNGEVSWERFREILFGFIGLRL